MKILLAASVALVLTLLVLRIPMCSTAKAAGAPPGDSLYQLTLPLSGDDGKAAGLEMFRGHPVVISLFYASCPYVCPTLIKSIQQMENQLDAGSRGRLRVLLVSLDPEHDTPEVLGQLAKRHHADAQRWRFAQTADTGVRKLAAALGVQYRQLPDGNFNHSTVITLLDSEGRITAQTSVLGRVDEDFLKQLRIATAR